MSAWIIRDPDGRIIAVLAHQSHTVEMWLQRHTPFSYTEALRQGFTIEETP